MQYFYERPLEGTKSPGRLRPDFSFVTDAGDVIIWEHLGMLDRDDYRRGWEWKNHALQLAFTSHQRIELGIHRGLGQVAGKLTQQGRFALTLQLSFFLAGTGRFLADGRKV